MVTMASNHDESSALRHNVELDLERSRRNTSTGDIQELCLATKEQSNRQNLDADIVESIEPLSMEDNCRADHDHSDPTITISSTSKLAGRTVAPFLAKHIPEQYAPFGPPQTTSISRKDPNTKYCYRHRPDSKCRRTADEPTMENLQRVRHTIYPSPLTSHPSYGPRTSTNMIPGTRDLVAIRSTRYLSCLDTLLRCTIETSKPHASGHLIAMLLSTIILPLLRCQESHSN